MIPSGVEIYVALEPVDMRLSFDRLAGLAQEQTGYDARSGALFIFFGRRRDSLKVLFFDGSGMVIFYKRLDRHCRRKFWKAAITIKDPAAREALLRIRIWTMGASASRVGSGTGAVACRLPLAVSAVSSFVPV